MGDEVKTIKKNELKHLLYTRYPHAEIVLADREYAILDESWVEKQAYKGFLAWVSIFGFKYKIQNSLWKKNWDCDDMSTSFKVYLRFLHASFNPNTFSETYLKNVENETDAESVAVGSIFYKNSPTSGHAINMLIDSKEEVTFFEPKHGGYVSLSEAEENNIWYINF
jgi:hypothetical protein